MSKQPNPAPTVSAVDSYQLATDPGLCRLAVDKELDRQHTNNGTIVNDRR